MHVSLLCSLCLLYSSLPRCQCNNAVSPLLMRWRYCSLVLSHQYMHVSLLCSFCLVYSSLPRCQCKTAASPLLPHWRCCSLAPSHQYVHVSLLSSLCLLYSSSTGCQCKTVVSPLLMHWRYCSIFSALAMEILQSCIECSLALCRQYVYVPLLCSFFISSMSFIQFPYKVPMEEDTPKPSPRHQRPCREGDHVSIYIVSGSRRSGRCDNIQYPTEIHRKCKSRKISSVHIIYLIYQIVFDILHRARQWHCHALSKISKQLDIWKIRYG